MDQPYIFNQSDISPQKITVQMQSAQKQSGRMLQLRSKCMHQKQQVRMTQAQ